MTTNVADDRLARRNALLLGGAQAIGGATTAVNMTLGGLTGVYLLGEDPTLATLPVTAMLVGTAMGAMPAALLMARVGRRPGFMAGTLIGALGGAVAWYGIMIASFWLFCGGCVMTGLAFAFVQQYRFAAADTASDAFRPKAISWVLAGGVLAGVIGPQTVIFAKDLFEPVSFAGAYLAQSLLWLVSFVILAFLRIPRTPMRPRAATDRSIRTILSQPRIVVAIVCGVISYSVMSLVMTAAPLAIVSCGFSTEEAALGIQWHVLAMFGPSFVTGSLIARFGAPRITFAGLVLLLGAGAVALAGIELAHFWISLILLGLGWNFGFIGATSLLIEAQRPEEKARLQAANDLLVFGFVALASLSSGAIFNHLGWEVVVWVAVPMVAAAALTLGWLALARRRHLKAA